MTKSVTKTWWFRIDNMSHKLHLPRPIRRVICDDMDWRISGGEVGKRLFPFGKHEEWDQRPVKNPEPIGIYFDETGDPIYVVTHGDGSTLEFRDLKDAMESDHEMPSE